MGVQSRSFLKTKNRDFNNIIDTIPSVKDDFTVVSSTGNTDLSSLSLVGTHTVLISVALADDNYIRLPEATTESNAAILLLSKLLAAHSTILL